jgi:hypothetical protein
MMSNLSYYERLVESATLVVRHPDFPDKALAVDQCRQEVEDLLADGRINLGQAEALRTILSIGTKTRAVDGLDGRGRWSRPDYLGRGEVRGRARASVPF